MQPHFARPLATRLHPRAIPLLEKSGGIAVFLEGKTTPRLAINNLVSKFQQQTSKPHDLCLKNHLPLYFLNHLLIHSSQFPHFLLQVSRVSLLLLSILPNRFSIPRSPSSSLTITLQGRIDMSTSLGIISPQLLINN
nr:hypothetical protein Itr_chr04CG14090 [Ipomoea trifida]